MAVVVVVVGCGAWVFDQRLDPRSLSWAIVAVGGPVSAWYLLRQAILLLRRPRRPRRIDITDVGLSSHDAVRGGQASLAHRTRPSSTSSATGPSHRL